jgi:hypothetical protein
MSVITLISRKICDKARYLQLQMYQVSKIISVYYSLDDVNQKTINGKLIPINKVKKQKQFQLQF